MARKVYYFDMDGVLCNFHKEKYCYANAISREWIANLDPFMENVNLVRNLINENKSGVYILSRAASEEAKQGKMDWLAKYIPELKAERVIILVKASNKDKVRNMKTKTGILVDDDPKNLKYWMEEGHEGILVEYKGATVVL